MLVLERKLGQALKFTTSTGETVLVKVNKVGNGRVSVCIDAPKTVKVLRNELATAILPDGEPPATSCGD